MKNSTTQAVADFALTFPDTWVDHPWGDTVIKVRKKIVVMVNESSDDLRFSLKLPESAADALESEYATPTGYGLGKSGWVSFAIPAGKEPPMELLEAYVLEAYCAVAPKTLVKQLLGQ
ncbi:MAG: MmcQ/YjbR family DNA-binding protein [Proteobacteria bacterium]|nr:MmcQ/YjbR family DNA-binding protein [Pseudomonadota bacterium]